MSESVFNSDFKVVAVVQFNQTEALVLNRPIKFVYHEREKSFIGVDGPFRDYLAYGGGSGAFAGRELSLLMDDGSVRKIKDQWWASLLDGYNDVVVGSVEQLQNCYVFHGAKISSEDWTALRATYSGCIYPYRDYEKVICYDKERKTYIDLWFKEQAKVKSLVSEVKRRTRELEALRDRMHSLQRDAKARAEASYSTLVERALHVSETMGEAVKLETGRFGKAELDAHCTSAEYLGAHRAYAAMETLISVALVGDASDVLIEVAQ